MLLGAVLPVIAIPIGGLWLWGRPRAEVSLPTYPASPADVVKLYVRAMDVRDFDACRRMGIADRTTVGANWMSLHAPNVTNLRIDRVHSIVPGARAAKEQYNSQLRGWEQTVAVDTTATLNNFNGFQASRPGEPWSYELVRHDDSSPGLIFDQGQG
ncbi:hypothetical protein [Flexivirga caeni]|uniref:Uncharacterized protein n=1 Tax=Flexivirga caeni TaxID=2294115 RepID=A0A3M9MJH1_9MICO|nr:hypothetical protein [Flexivirga caeni]RNI25335.1 hypothetical protein EFY87_01505 [Flexivirga caeni]